MIFYFIVLLLAAVLILIACVRRGFKRGLAKEFSGTVSLLVGTLVVVLLANAFSKYQNRDFPELASGIILLIILAAVYRIVRALLGSIRLLSGLPVISWLDRGLGAVFGFIKCFVILYLCEFMLRNYIL